MKRDAERSDDAVLAACGIAVMAKASRPGRTKTRLVPPLTFTEAAAFNTAFLQDVAANIAAANAVAGGAAISGYMAFGPPDAAPFFGEILPRSVGLIEAWYADFGDCLFTAVSHLLSRGHIGAVVLNSDSPTLPTALLTEAAEMLARPGDRAVLGPSADGGYYLLGLKAPHRRLFDDVAWSTESVADQTLQRAAEVGLDVHVLPAWYDVDDIVALRMLQGELCDGMAFAPGLSPYRAPHSRRLLVELLGKAGLARRLAEPDLGARRLHPDPLMQSAAE